MEGATHFKLFAQVVNTVYTAYTAYTIHTAFIASIAQTTYNAESCLNSFGAKRLFMPKSNIAR